MLDRPACSDERDLEGLGGEVGIQVRCAVCNSSIISEKRGDQVGIELLAGQARISATACSCVHAFRCKPFRVSAS
jgi:hypothetical protein